MGRSKAPSLPIKALSFCRPTELRGKSREAGKGECISDARRAVVWFFHKRAPSINLEAPHHNPRTKGASNLSPLRTFGPVGRQPSSPKGRQGGCMVFAAKGGIKNGAESAVPRQRSDTI